MAPKPRRRLGVPSSMGLRQPSLTKSRRRVLVALTLAAASATLAAVLARAREPSYRGHPLSAWIKAISPRNQQSLEPGCTYDDAPEAIIHMGTNSLPFLVKWLSYQCGATPVRDFVNWAIEKCASELDFKSAQSGKKNHGPWVSLAEQHESIYQSALVGSFPRLDTLS